MNLFILVCPGGVTCLIFSVAFFFFFFLGGGGGTKTKMSASVGEFQIHKRFK